MGYGRNLISFAEDTSLWLQSKDISNIMKNSFQAAVMAVSISGSLANASQACTPFRDSKFGTVDLNIVSEIISTNNPGLNGELMTAGPLYFANPLSQILLGVREVDSGNSERALPHLDLASYLLYQNELCSKNIMEFLVFAVRKRAIEDILVPGMDLQIYMNFTHGLVEYEKELVSQDYESTKRCISEFFLDSESGILEFEC